MFLAVFLAKKKSPKRDNMADVGTMTLETNNRNNILRLNKGLRLKYSTLKKCQQKKMALKKKRQQIRKEITKKRDHAQVFPSCPYSTGL